MDVPGLFQVYLDHGFDDTTAPTQRKLDVTNDVIYDICTREAWPFLEVRSTIAGAGADGSITMPADFGNALSLYDTTNGQKLSYWRYDDFMDGFSTQLTQAGTPYLYYFVANQIYTYPVATTDSLELRYIKRPNVLTAVSAENAIVIPKYWHSLIWNGALAQLYDMTDDSDIAVHFEARFDKKYQLMRETVWKRQYDSPEFIHFIDEFGRRVQ